MADPVGVCIAFGAGPLDASPSWTRLDAPPYPAGMIAGYSIRRGRTDEFERTGTGTATIHANDTKGDLDPTAGAGLDAQQAAIALHNPVMDSWATIFRGIIDDHTHDVDPSQLVTRVDIDCVDGLDYLAGFELRPGVDGTAVPFGSEGNVYYPVTDPDGVDTRINWVLDDTDWPVGLREVFTGNVKLQATVYSPGTGALSVIDECCDAEFPGIANRWISKDGLFTFHGRLARFNPTYGPYHITTWKVGDGAAVDADNTYAHLRGLTFSRPRAKIVNSALFSPQGVADIDIPGLLVEDTGSISAYGLHSLTADNLRIDSSILTGNSAYDECVLFGTYYTSTYNEPRTNVDQIVFRPVAPDDPRAAAVWALLCGIDISDRIQLKVALPGGGGFSDELYFVEGISYEVTPLQPDYQNVTLTVDVSNAGYYDFAWT